MVFHKRHKLKFPVQRPRVTALSLLLRAVSSGPAKGHRSLGHTANSFFETPIASSVEKRFLSRTTCRCWPPGKVVPYNWYLAERVKAAAPEWIAATVLLGELKTPGDPGGYSIVRGPLVTLRPLGSRTLVRLDTETRRQV
jgi:hypothetical protein